MTTPMLNQPIVRVARRTRGDFYEAFSQDPRIKDRHKLNRVLGELLPWLLEQEETGNIEPRQRLRHVSEQHRRNMLTRDLFQRFKKDKYGSIWTILAWEAIKLIVWWIIESYLFGLVDDND